MRDRNGNIITVQQKRDNIIRARDHHRTKRDRQDVALANLKRHLDDANSQLIKFTELKKVWEKELKGKPNAKRGLHLQTQLPGLERQINETTFDIARMEREIATLER